MSKALTYLGLAGGLLVAPCTGWAQVSNVRVVGTTATQAILSWDAPDSNPCTVAVSEKAKYTPPVADVDPAKFPGSNSDSRFSQLGQGFVRYFVVGTVPGPSGLIANRAADGCYYGRALKPHTEHYYQVTCGTSTTTGTFTTRNLPLGKTYGEPQPIAGPGVYAYPSIFTAAQWASANPRTYQFRDPVYGLPMQFITLPGDQTNDYTNAGKGEAFGAAGTCTNWTTPAYLYQSSRGNYGAYSGTTQDKCAITVGSRSFTIRAQNWPTDAVEITLTGHSSVVDGTNNIVDACLTLDGSTCATPVQTYSLGRSDSTICFPNAATCNSSTVANRPKPWSSDWSQPPILADATGPPSGESPATLGISANANFGVLLWKAGSGASTISIRNVNFSVYASYNESWYDGGEEWACNNNTINDGSGVAGYLCEVPGLNGRQNLFWILTDTGEARFLGLLSLSGGVLTDFNGTVYAGGGTQTFSVIASNVLYFVMRDSNSNVHVTECRLPRSGDRYYNQSVAANADAHCTWSDLTRSPNYLQVLINNFDSDFSFAKFPNISNQGIQNQYLLWTALSGVQNSPAWLGAFDVNTGQVIAAMPDYAGGKYSGPPSSTQSHHRWCGFHTTHSPGNTNHWMWVDHTATPADSRVPAAWVTTTLASSIGPTDPSVTFSSAPTLLAVAANDYFRIDSECIMVTAVSGGNNFTVLRGQSQVCGSAAASHSAGATVQMICEQGIYDGGAFATFWWDFANDPHATNKIVGHPNTVFDEQDKLTAHYSYAISSNGSTGSGVSEINAWSACRNYAPGTNCPNVTGCPSRLASCAETVTASPAFAGQVKSAAGNSYEKHPTSVHQVHASGVELQWGTDMPVLSADSSANPASLTNVTGKLFSFTPNSSWNLKVLPAVAIAGYKPLLDVSGPSSSIGGTSGDAYRYCYVYKSGECHSGSTASQVYVNAPYLTTGSVCYGGNVVANYMPYTESQLCFTNYGAFADRLDQMSLQTNDLTGANTRALTYGFTPYGFKGRYSNAQPTPDGKWLMFPITEMNGRIDVVEVQTPPWPASDGVNRTDFERETVKLWPPQGQGIASAEIEFGYDTNFYCTSRQETCVEVGSWTNGSANPFWYETSDAGSFTPTTCTTSCSIDVPVIPGHVVYYRAKYLNGSGGTVTRGSTQAKAVY